MGFTKPKKFIGLDIGGHSVKAVQMARSGGRLIIEEVGYAQIDRNQLTADPLAAQAAAVSQAMALLDPKRCGVVGALPGQAVVIRYPRLALTGASRTEIDVAVQREAGQNIPYDLSEVYLDWSVLDEQAADDKTQLKILLVAAKHEVIDARVQIIQAAEEEFSMLGVDSLALADAAEACQFLREGETVALINVGLSAVSIHFVKDGVSNFIRDVSWGSRELIQAIAKEMRCDLEQAEFQLRQSSEPEPAMAAAPEAAAADDAPVATFEPEPEAQPAAEFGEDPFGDMSGGSMLDPLDDETDAPPAKSAGPAKRSGERTVEDIIATPLSRLVSEIRRSFDYYEHQLYERPVDRIILSGGVAHLPAVLRTLNEELGLEIDVADPTASALMLGDEAAIAPLREHPAQFMVAIGLAARGMADL